MIPILFKAETEPERLRDVNGVLINDANGVELFVPSDFATVRAFETYGIGALSDCISCEVEEERNGPYELSMEYPDTGVHYNEMGLRSIILAKPNAKDDPQPFRIYYISEPIDGRVTVNARHLSYDLSSVPVLPFNATSAGAACAGLMANAAIKTPFTIGTQLGTIADFAVDVPSSVRSWFGGKEGSLIDVYGGEWHYDGYSCTLLPARGEDRGVVIRYGVNMLDFQQEKNCEEVWTGVLPYWADEEGTVVRANIINIEGSFDYRRILCLDLSQDFEEQPTKAQLTARAQTYITANNIGVPKVSITLDWAQLNEQVELCDTVKVVFERLGVETTAKCVRTVWDVLKDRYSSIEIGDARTNITDTIHNLQQEEEKQKTSVSNAMLRAIANATALITGNSGGYVILHDGDGDGYPDELLVMNTPDVETATSVWRFNKSGLGFSGSGYGGPYGLAMTADGQIVADYITTGTLDASQATITNLNASNITSGTMSANYIKGGTLSLGGLNDGMGLLKVFNSSGVERARINNLGITAYDVFSAYHSQLDGTRLDFFNASNTNACTLSVNTSDQAFLYSIGALSLSSSSGGVSISPASGKYLSFLNVYNTTTSSAANLFLYSGGVVYRSTASSKRYKHDITEDLGELDPKVLYNLPVVRFKFNNDYLNEDDQRYGKDVIGFIAEDVEETYPVAVSYDDTGQPEMWQSNYLIPAMMKLIQNQKKEIDELRARLDRLEALFKDDGR